MAATDSGRMVETLSEHLHLDYRVQRPVAELKEDFVLLLAALSAVDLSGLQAALLVEAAHLAGVIH